MKKTQQEQDSKHNIIIKGAETHNLKKINITIPRNKLIVITGVSGSGKSSLAFDTLYAEGQRRYVESLNSYARQFLDRMSRPKVEYIKGLSPAIAIEQKVNSRNPRSTVGTSSEIYEYIKLLYARIGKTYSPISGEEVKKESIIDIIDYLLKKPINTKAIIISNIVKPQNRSWGEQIALLTQQGFSRIKINNEILRLTDLTSEQNTMLRKNNILELVIDRITVKDQEDFRSRVADSIQTALFEGKGSCKVVSFEEDGIQERVFSSLYEKDNILFEEPSTNLFSFNNPYGACKSCGGLGIILGYDPDLIVPDKNLSIYEGAIACWRGEKMNIWNKELIHNAEKFKFPIHRPYYDLTQSQKDLLWKGNKYFHGIDAFFKDIESQSYKIQYRVMLSRYRGKTICPDCQGTRLRKDAGYVKINNKSIIDLLLMPLNELQPFFKNIELKPHEKAIAERILTEVLNRISFLINVGLSYLTLSRLSNTLSGGESQRINLATSLGSSLVGALYILDEPSIGLHPRDTDKLIEVLKQLRDIGNTVIIVEHDENIIMAADEIIDIGPFAGKNGGKLVFQGTHDALLTASESLTADYIVGRKQIPLPKVRRKWNNQISLMGCSHHNLKHIDVTFPLNTLCCVTGVSGSGKTSLVKGILYPALKKIFGGTSAEKTGQFDRLSGDYKTLSFVELIDQNPIGRSSRSNPATYSKAFDEIRQLFSQEKLSKIRGYTPGFFSFNIPGGRCEHCEGEGVVKIEMQFMADLYLTCEHCKGKRFKDEVLEIQYNGKSIADVLNLSVEEAIIFFSQGKPTTTLAHIFQKIKPLSDVGMGYVKLGQASSTLSGGEAQRIKLASFLNKGYNDKKGLFIFDEPTTGLHLHDINKLIISLNALIEYGHSVIVIEHHPDIIKSADWIIDLGPDGGINGGMVSFIGTPEELAKEKNNYTAFYMKEKIDPGEIISH